MSVFIAGTVTGPVDINILCFASRRDHAFTIAGGGYGSLINTAAFQGEILRAGF
jgi:hypothetical protein